LAAEKMFSPREASKVLGISYATLKLWIYKGKIRTIKTAGGHHRIPESQLDKFLHSASDRGEVATKRTGFRNISGRNQLLGRASRI
jgi:excisionase family DNA binding protein